MLPDATEPLLPAAAPSLPQPVHELTTYKLSRCISCSKLHPGAIQPIERLGTALAPQAAIPDFFRKAATIQFIVSTIGLPASTSRYD